MGWKEHRYYTETMASGFEDLEEISQGLGTSLSSWMEIAAKFPTGFVDEGLC